MGKVQKFVVELQFDNDVGVYIAGHEVRGHVEVQLSEPLEIRRIHVTINGKAEVHWTEQHGETTAHYHAKETYFDEKQVLTGSEKGRVTLPAGLSRFPFSYTMPADVPSTFAGEHGKVRYKVAATLDKPWAFDDHTQRHFTVVGLLNLNAPEYADFTRSCVADVTKEASGLFHSGPVSAKVTLSRRCFVPGETLYLSAEIRNQSNGKINKVWASLKQYHVFRANRSKRVGTKRLNTITRQEVIGPGAVESWSNVPVILPALPPTDLAGRCPIMEVRYALKFYTDLGLKVAFPLIIGTVALQSKVPIHYQLPTLPQFDEPRFDEPPPSYEDVQRNHDASKQQ